MVKALLVGCGNIGAGYDRNDPGKVWTHARAYSLERSIELFIYDKDESLAGGVAEQYKVKAVSKLDESDYGKFDIISITTPTPTHFFYLKRSLNARVPVIICEKPLVNTQKEVHELKKLYADSHSQVVVNYMRRFQPAYVEARERFRAMPEASFRGIIVKYKRGFLNNAGHAIDLIEFLTDTEFGFDRFRLMSACFDAFHDDPTLTAACAFREQPVSFVGVSDVNYPVFEIEFFFSQGKIVVCHSGDEVRYYVNENGKGLYEERERRQEHILDRYMVPVVREALDLFHKTKSGDNFTSALRINEAILKIIEPIKN